MCNFGDGAEVWLERVRRARKAHVCEECNLPILPKQKYLHVSYVQDGRGGSFCVHRECKVLAEEASEVVCGSGDYTVGELMEHVEYCEEAVHPDGPLNVTGYHTIEPRDAARVLAEWEAIQHRYDGVERDLGGEGG